MLSQLKKGQRRPVVSDAQILKDLQELTFFTLHEQEWIRVADFDRLADVLPFNKHQMILKLGQDRRNELEQHAYDCYSLYRHSDETYDWRPCRIVRRDLKETVEQKDLFVKQITQEVNLYNYVYWIEFEHFKEDGHHMWSMREAKDILFGCEYTRNNQPRFELEATSYLNKMYAPQE